MKTSDRIKSVVRRVFPPNPKPLILMYHRIADEILDPWALAVSPVHFEEQLSVLRRTRHPFPLTEFAAGLVSGTLPNSVALTFDDGYVDNLEFAKPRLVAADVPATVFLITGYIDNLEPFWWDTVAALILSEKTLPDLELTVGGKVVRPGFDKLPPGGERDPKTEIVCNFVQHLGRVVAFERGRASIGDNGGESRA